MAQFVPLFPSILEPSRLVRNLAPHKQKTKLVGCQIQTVKLNCTIFIKSALNFTNV